MKPDMGDVALKEDLVQRGRHQHLSLFINEAACHGCGSNMYIDRGPPNVHLQRAPIGRHQHLSLFINEAACHGCESNEYTDKGPPPVVHLPRAPTEAMSVSRPMVVQPLTDNGQAFSVGPAFVLECPSNMKHQWHILFGHSKGQDPLNGLHLVPQWRVYMVCIDAHLPYDCNSWLSTSLLCQHP